MSGSIWSLSGYDTRRQFLSSVQAGEPFSVQKATGKSVEHFDSTNGFTLLRERALLKPESIRAQRVASVAELSLGPSRELREFYYTLRGMPNLVEPFKTANEIYKEVLTSINYMEIYCDVDRANFTSGNIPKGFIHYGHDWTYGREDTPIGFTENQARGALDSYTINGALNIVHMEKQAAATRLVSMGFSKLTNSVITTTGGNFTRGVYELTRRFHNDKQMIFYTDGDAFGQDMQRALAVGTMNSRHLTPQNAFPEDRYENVHNAGLFPSVAERIGVPNDVDKKRPMTNPHVRKRVEFLERYGLADWRDLETWNKDLTYELEGMSAHYTSTKDESPVGLGIYLLRLMRLKGIPLKTFPEEGDADLLRKFGELVKDDFRSDVRTAADGDSPVDRLNNMISKKIETVVRGIVQEVYEEHEDRLQAIIDDTDPETIRNHAAKQYEDNPLRERYSLQEVAYDITQSVDIKVKWNPDELIKVVEEAVDKYVDGLGEDLYDAEVEFEELEDIEEPRDFYDVAEDFIGADPHDCEELGDALAWRLDL